MIFILFWRFILGRRLFWALVIGGLAYGLIAEAFTPAHHHHRPAAVRPHPAPAPTLRVPAPPYGYSTLLWSMTTVGHTSGQPFGINNQWNGTAELVGGPVVVCWAGPSANQDMVTLGPDTILEAPNFQAQNVWAQLTAGPGCTGLASTSQVTKILMQHNPNPVTVTQMVDDAPLRVKVWEAP